MEQVKVNILQALATQEATGTRASYDDCKLTESGEERAKELAYHLIELEEDGYVEFVRNPFIKGGNNDVKYKNNVRIVALEDVKLTKRGRELV